MSLLQVDRLGQSYVDAYSGEQTHAVGDVSFEIADGEFVALLGPSGCGKTTVLNIVAGFVQATSGQVLVAGDAVRGPGPDRGVVFQDFALFPWLTVKQNITFGLRMQGADKRTREAKADAMIELVGLGGFGGKYPHELSGGMRQRTGVARVLATEPTMMLMDEPFASIDAQTRRVLQQEVLRIWDSQRPTVLFVTHDVEEAIFMADRVIVLSGRPSSVAADIRVPFERPRTWAEIQRDARFTELRSELLGLLGVED